MNKGMWDKMLKLGVVDFCQRLKDEGKIRYLGFSFHDSYEVFEEMIGARDWDFCQIQLNYMDAEEQAGMKGYLLTEQKQIPLVIMEPVKGGSLAKFRTTSPTGSGLRIRTPAQRPLPSAGWGACPT